MHISGKIAVAVLGVVFMFACSTVHNANHVTNEQILKEGTVVFVRPTKHTLLGTKSISDYVEVSYEEMTVNEGGLPVVKVGFRNRGGTHFFDREGGDFLISVKASFYDKPIGSSSGTMHPPVYNSNWQTIKLLRGATYHFSVACPVKSARYYQVTVSELLK